MPKPQQHQGSPFMESYVFAKWAIQFPALTVMVILRRDMGYRLLNPLILIAVFGCLAVIAILASPGNQAARPIDLLIFAGVGFASGIAQRIRRWSELNRNVPQHSYYIGSSPFNFRFLPQFFKRNRRMARFIDPAFCALIGVILLPYSRALALYLICSGLCLRAYEHYIHVTERNRELDIADSLITSEIESQTMEQFDQARSAPQQQSDSGVPTGMSDDVREHIKRRKTK